MTETMKMAITEMELAGMWSKLQSLKQNFSDSPETFKQLDGIADEIDALRRQLGIKIELSK